MKKKILFASMIAFAGIFVSCNNNPDGPTDEKVEQPDSILVYNIGADKTETLSKISYYTYDEVGNMICQLDSLIGETYIYKEKIEMTYNSKGKVTSRKKSSYFITKASWIEGLWLVYHYGENDKLIQYDIYDHFHDTIQLPPSQYPPIKKCIFSWSDDTHAECLIYNSHTISNEVEWKYVQAQDYIVNERGDTEKLITYAFNTEKSEGEIWFIEEYSYDQYDNVLSCRKQEKGITKLRETYRYEYDEKGKILVKWYSSSQSDTEPGEPTAKYVYCY